MLLRLLVLAVACVAVIPSLSAAESAEPAMVSSLPVVARCQVPPSLIPTSLSGQIQVDRLSLVIEQQDPQGRPDRGPTVEVALLRYDARSAMYYYNFILNQISLTISDLKAPLAAQTWTLIHFSSYELQSVEPFILRISDDGGFIRWIPRGERQKAAFLSGPVHCTFVHALAAPVAFRADQWTDEQSLDIAKKLYAQGLVQSLDQPFASLPSTVSNKMRSSQNKIQTQLMDHFKTLGTICKNVDLKKIDLVYDFTGQWIGYTGQALCQPAPMEKGPSGPLQQQFYVVFGHPRVVALSLASAPTP